MSGPRFDPAHYPGPRPSGPVVVRGGEVAGLDPAARAALDERIARDEVVCSVAYGSNASPERLFDKGLDAAGAWLLPATIDGWVPAFEARRTGYGAVPLTFVPEPAARTATWVLALPRTALPTLDRTEGRVADHTPVPPPGEEGDADGAPPGTYQLGRVGRVVLDDGAWLADGLAYLPGPRARVQVDGDGTWRTWPRVDQGSARRHLDVGGPSQPAPPVTTVVLGPWPATPLLRPG
ncbi:MAG: hypothetical protein JJT89_03530 [Nitriliruptoraceae bacterium]|nr:hypothetical protein [Nitriliruptoraceae bacterium]